MIKKIFYISVIFVHVICVNDVYSEQQKSNTKIISDKLLKTISEVTKPISNMIYGNKKATTKNKPSRTEINNEIQANPSVTTADQKNKKEDNSGNNDLKILSNVKELKSNRGIRFFYMKDSSAPLVHIKIAFKNSGAAYQEKSKIGVPKLFSQAVFLGCGKYSSVEYEKEVSDIVSKIQCSSDVDRIYFDLTAPTMVLDKAVTLLNLALTDPKFEQDKLKIIQESIVTNLQNYTRNPGRTAMRRIIPSIIFKGHIYENGSYGSSENFAKISVADFKDYKERFLVTSNAKACVFGDISEAKAIQTIDKIFEKIAPGKAAEDTVSEVKPLITSLTERYYAPGPQSVIVFALKSPKFNASDIYEAAIASLILGGPMFKAKIMGILRSKFGYIYGGSTHIVHLSHASYIVGILQTDNTKVEKAIDALKEIIRDLRNKGITQEELDFAKSYINGSFLVQLRTSERFCYFYFSEMLKGFGTNALNEKLENINKVTLSAVNKFCKENFDENNIPFVIIGGNAK